MIKLFLVLIILYYIFSCNSEDFTNTVTTGYIDTTGFDFCIKTNFTKDAKKLIEPVIDPIFNKGFGDVKINGVLDEKNPGDFYSCLVTHSKSPSGFVERTGSSKQFIFPHTAGKSPVNCKPGNSCCEICNNLVHDYTNNYTHDVKCFDNCQKSYSNAMEIN